MPTVAYFLGIAIRMYFEDHPPMHFHVSYQGRKAVFSIREGELMEGALPPAQQRIVRRWAELRRAELEANWRRARDGEPLERIPGVDDAD